MPKATDANQQAIIDALRAAGATVHSLHRVGGGCPDLLVGFRGQNYLLEVKNPDTYGRLGKKQLAWHKEWRGSVATVWDVEEALVAIGAIEQTQTKGD